MAYFGNLPSGPVTGGFAVTASDATTYSPPLRGIYVGVSGDVAVKFNNDETVTYVGLASGILHPIAGIKQILSTGTTATSIVSHRG